MTADSVDVDKLKSTARSWARGHSFDDFDIGRRFTHHWGRTVSQADNQVFSNLTLHYNPLYTNEQFAIAHGHPTSPLNPFLVFNVVFGLSVEDLSEGGGPFLSVNSLSFKLPAYPGDTLYSTSEVIAARRSAKRPGFGIVTWKTIGKNQHGFEIVEFERSNLVRVRP